MPKLESYDKSLDYSYCLGVFPSLELIAARPERVRRLLLAPEGEANEGVAKLKAACQALGIRAQGTGPPLPQGELLCGAGV